MKGGERDMGETGAANGRLKDWGCVVSARSNVMHYIAGVTLAL